MAEEFGMHILNGCAKRVLWHERCCLEVAFGEAMGAEIKTVEDVNAFNGVVRRRSA
jgi:hypothetical protein